MDQRIEREIGRLKALQAMLGEREETVKAPASALDLKKERAATLKERIAAVKRERAAAVARFDEDISALEAELAGIERTTDVDVTLKDAVSGRTSGPGQDGKEDGGKKRDEKDGRPKRG